MNNSNHLNTLRKAFNLVKSTTHWQEPIDTRVSLDAMSREQLSIGDIREAVEFYTGSVPTVYVEGKMVFVKAKGYRLTNQ
jgi:uncharacterized protein YjiS (DUF1127 family)